MLISLSVAPSFSLILTALLYVLSVVPKQGIVTHVIPFLSSPERSNALTVTSSASVESSPPDIPITALLQPVCSSLFLSPYVCMSRISSHLASLSYLSSGTNGALSKNLLSLSSLCIISGQLTYT